MKILIIDDDPSIRRVAAFALTKAGHELLQAASGEEGLALAFSAGPSLILLDAMMPGLDGPETCRRLKSDARTRDIPVVFLSADAGPEQIERFLSLGAAGAMAKPFDPLSLYEKVSAFLPQGGSDKNHH